MSTSNAAATAVNTAPSQAPVDPFDDPVTSNKMAVRALIPLLITFVLGTLCLQGRGLLAQLVLQLWQYSIGHFGGEAVAQLVDGGRLAGIVQLVVVQDRQAL